MARRLIYNSSAQAVGNGDQVQPQGDARGKQMVVGRTPVLSSANFTRPADTTAYASGDLVANSTTAGSVVAMSFAGVCFGSAAPAQIRRVRIATSSTSVTNAQFRLHLYKVLAITAANGDNGAWSTDNAANYIGFVDVTVDKAFTDGARGLSAQTEINCVPVTTLLYGLLEARAAYTPTSAGTFTVTLEIDQV